ncbi:MAG TPA: GreA/GreB family elongation factor [Candidatus Magasanikbacteria bacterium]|nr:GreA/GreB family elongation factor [Candidatus Magasanikbacteria bacterium]
MQIPYRKPGVYNYAKKDPLITADKFAQLQNKLERLKRNHPGAAAEVARLAQLGDFSENAEYQLAKGRLRRINNDIQILENQLYQAKIIQPQNTDKIQVGHTITVLIKNEQKKYTLLGSEETDPQKGVISHNSPLGSALLGRGIGEVIKVNTGDKIVEYKIIKIE